MTTGTVNYLAPGSERNRLYVAPGEHRGTTRYDPRTVPVADARPHAGELTLDRAGFTLIAHCSAVTGLGDPGQLDEVYTAEAMDLVKSLTGADSVVSLGWMLRRAATGAAERRGALPPAPDVHADLHD
ncbi:MAG: hypothetical protein J2P25_15385, partial [Nocardiopsaceae bacterium]|nr:hypothetical protein [Nocardiopsaceae bacterium]